MIMIMIMFVLVVWLNSGLPAESFNIRYYFKKNFQDKDVYLHQT